MKIMQIGPVDPALPMYTLTFHRNDDGTVESREVQNGIIPSERIALLANFTYQQIATDLEKGLAGLGDTIPPSMADRLRANLAELHRILTPIILAAQDATADYKTREGRS